MKMKPNSLPLASIGSRLSLPSMAALAVLCMLFNGPAYAVEASPNGLDHPFQISQHSGGGHGPGKLGPGRGKPGCNGGMHQSLEKLNLSDEQKQKLEVIKKEGAAEAHSLKDLLRQKRKAMMEYLASPSATEAKALAMQEDIARTQSQIVQLRIKAWFKMRNVFTPEQLQTIEKERKTRLDRLPRGGQSRLPFGPRPGDGFAPPAGAPQGSLSSSQLPSSEAYLSRMGAFLPGPYSLLNDSATPIR